MERTVRHSPDDGDHPDGVLAVVVFGVIGSVYATYVGIRGLTPEGSLEGAALALVALTTLALLLGLWQHRLWGYLGMLVLGGGTGLLFIRAGDPLAAAVSVGVFAYLVTLHGEYLASAVDGASQ